MCGTSGRRAGWRACIGRRDRSAVARAAAAIRKPRAAFPGTAGSRWTPPVRTPAAMQNRTRGAVSSRQLRFQGQRLLRIIALELRVLHYCRVYTDTHNLVALAHQVALAGDDDLVVAREEECTLGTDPGRIHETVELERNRRSVRSWRRRCWPRRRHRSNQRLGPRALLALLDPRDLHP